MKTIKEKKIIRINAQMLNVFLLITEIIYDKILNLLN